MPIGSHTELNPDRRKDKGWRKPPLRHRQPPRPRSRTPSPLRSRAGLRPQPAWRRGSNTDPPGSRKEDVHAVTSSPRRPHRSRDPPPHRHRCARQRGGGQYKHRRRKPAHVAAASRPVARQEDRRVPRQANGEFKAADELVLVPGIGDRTYELSSPDLTVKGDTTLKEKAKGTAPPEPQAGSPAPREDREDREGRSLRLVSAPGGDRGRCSIARRGAREVAAGARRAARLATLARRAPGVAVRAGDGGRRGRVLVVRSPGDAGRHRHRRGARRTGALPRHRADATRARRRRDRVVPADGAHLRAAAQRPRRDQVRDRERRRRLLRALSRRRRRRRAHARTSSSASIRRSSPGARSLTSVAASDSAFRPVRCRAIRPAGNRSAARATIPSASTARTSRRSRRAERRRPARSTSPMAGEGWSSVRVTNVSGRVRTYRWDREEGVWRVI